MIQKLANIGLILLVPAFGQAPQVQPTGPWNSPLRVVATTTSITIPSSYLVGNTEATNAGTNTWTLPQAGTTGFEASKWFVANNLSGTLTVNTSTSTFSGCSSSGSSFTINAGSSARFTSSGGNWIIDGCGGGGGGSGNVTAGGTLTSTAIVTGAGSTAIQTPNTSATMDNGGNVSTPGTASFGVGSSVQGAVGLGCGSTATLSGNYIGLVAPGSCSGSHYMQMPSTGATTSSQVLVSTAAESGGVTQVSWGTSASGSQYSVTGQAGLLTNSSGDTIVAATSNLPALAAGGCWNYDLLITNSQSNNFHLKLWFGSGMTVGATYTSGSSLVDDWPIVNSPSPLLVTGAVCNNNGSQSAQTAEMFTFWHQSNGGFGTTGSMAQSTTATNLQIGLSINSQNIITVQRFRVWLAQ